MAEAFLNQQNQLVSNSAAAINAENASTVAPEDNVFGRNGGRAAAGRRRRGDDDEDLYDDDDMESLMSQPVNGANGMAPARPEEEVELPAHACAYCGIHKYAHTNS